MTLCIWLSSQLSSEPIRIPEAKAPIRIDGKISPGEWAGAATFRRSDGGEVLLLRSEKEVFAAFRGKVAGVCNLFIRDASGAVHVLHASAALGQIRYEAKGDHYAPANQFDWACRDDRGTAAGEQERQEYFDKHGWVANPNGMGDPGTVEFKLKSTRLIGDGITAAFSFFEDSSKPLGVWPSVKGGDENSARLAGGWPPEKAQFGWTGWGRFRT